MATTSITERIRQNRIFVDDWSVNERLLLASAVLKSGDQNWGSVSKLIINYFKCDTCFHKKRPSDWFAPKACNTQYQLLIETYANDLPRRKKRDRNSSDSTTETPVNYIYKQLWKLRLAEIDETKQLKQKQEAEIEQMLRDALQGRLSQEEQEAHYEYLQARLHEQETRVEREYQETVRVREEKRKLIEANTSTFPGSVNSSLILSSTADEKSSSPTSPLLTSLLQSPSRSTTPIMSNLLISKLLETPSPPSQIVQTTPLPASSLLQKELSRPVPQSTQAPLVAASSAVSLVPLPTPSPNSLAALDDLRGAVLPDDLAGVVMDKSGEEVEEFDEKWFDPSVLNMGKEELAKALLGLDIITGRNESVESDALVPDEVLPLDLDDPATVEEEVVLEEHIIQSVENAMDSTRGNLVKAEPLVDPPDLSKPHESNEVKPQVESTTLDAMMTEVKEEEDKEVHVTMATSSEEKVKPTCTEDSVTVMAPALSSSEPATTPATVPPTSPLKSKIPKLASDPKDPPTPSHPPPLVLKETRSLRASRDSEKSAADTKRELTADNGGADSKSGRRADTGETRERRRSRLGEDPSPVRKAVSPTLPPPASPVKETRSSRLLREESQSSPSKELRSLRSTESSSSLGGGKELRPRGGSTSRGGEGEAGASPSLGSKELRTRGRSSSRGESEAASPRSPVPRSPRNSKDVESSPVKETRSKSREEPPSPAGPGKLKESPAKEVKASRGGENARKSLLDTSSSKKSLEPPTKRASESSKADATSKTPAETSRKSPDTPTRALDTSSKIIDTSSSSEIRRRLRSEPDFPGHLHESEDSSGDESSHELLEEMTLDMINDPLMGNVSSLPADVQEEFKAPLTAGGRKRKMGEGRASPFLSDKESKPVQDPRAKKTLLAVYQTILTYKHASVFMKPVSDAQANNYSAIVRVQANLAGIKKRIESGAIRSVCQFQRSVLLVFTNAMMYNNVSDALYNSAKETMIECNKDLQILVKAVADSGGVEYSLAPAGSDPAGGDPPSAPHHSGSDRTKRSSTASPLPMAARKKRRGGDEEEEKEEEGGGGRRGTKRAAAPSPSQHMQGKKRKMK